MTIFSMLEVETQNLLQKLSNYVATNDRNKWFCSNIFIISIMLDLVLSHLGHLFYPAGIRKTVS